MLLALVLGLGMAAGLAHAGDPPDADTAPTGLVRTGGRPDAYTAPTGVPVIVNSRCPSCQNGRCADTGPPPRFPYVNHVLSHCFPCQQKDYYPCCECWSHHDAFLVGTLRSEACYIFGSSRNFFAEPCYKRPQCGYLPQAGCDCP
jgi:hypothetical protein